MDIGVLLTGWAQKFGDSPNARSAAGKGPSVLHGPQDPLQWLAVFWQRHSDQDLSPMRFAVFCHSAVVGYQREGKVGANTSTWHMGYLRRWDGDFYPQTRFAELPRWDLAA
jgi:hypothetical protein